MLRLVLLSVFLKLGLVACSPAVGSDPTDAGARADAGTPARDAGTPASDAGTPASDAGTPASDAGTSASDAGTPASDAGTPAGDAGVACDLGYTGPTCAERFPSCQALLTAFPDAPDGTYAIDPDGPNAGEGPFDAWCDMTWDGGGWTLIMATNGLGPDDQTTAIVSPGSGTHLSRARVHALAADGVSAEVHIRSQGNAANRSFTSLPGNLAIQNLRRDVILNDGSGITSAEGPTPGFIGPYAEASRLHHTCDTLAPYDTPGAWPNVWWTCGNALGLHLLGTGSRWTFEGNDEPLEVYVR